MTVASGSGCPWQLDEAFALLPYVVAPSVSLLRALADELTRSISSTSSPSRAMTQPTSSSIFRIQILRLVEIPIPTGTEILWALHWDLQLQLDSGKCISVDLGPAASHRDTFSMSISNTDSQVQRNPLRSICPGPACDSGHDPVYPSATGERSDLPGKAVHAMVGMPVQAEETGGPRGQVCGLGGAWSGAFCVPTTAPVAGTQHV
ncbi:hypothetical protein AFUB_061920 [Aspergillus fumigatus A1163]|uniref:Uncharacterized protein n=1 Tax=Aspergillus fumigatus (strain CBS 144.89 / FGSC A1163 / CEA10) TaxID=451804 RepID=B0Y2I3_ASPFC|nr:hypothetical protein AFUB_061920 [Aspergillus fumigatus A1163]